MKKILYVFLLFPAFIVAQINKSDSLNVKVNLSLTGFYQSGNVETLIFRAKSDLSFTLLKKMKFKTTNSYVYQEFGNEKADEDFLSLNFLHFSPKKKISPLLLGFFSTNFRREIDFRYLLGAGFTIKAIEKEKYSLKFSISSEYESTSFNEFSFNKEVYNGSQYINTFRGTLWANGKYKLFKNKVVLTHQSYFQPSLQESNNYRWQADIGIALPIWKFLDFKINYLHTFESVVIASQKQQDEFLTFGLTLKSY